MHEREEREREREFTVGWSTWAGLNLLTGGQKLRQNFADNKIYSRLLPDKIFRARSNFISARADFLQILSLLDSCVSLPRKVLAR